MDFFTIDTTFNKRFLVHFIISHKTREIVQFAVTETNSKLFVKQQMIEFEHNVNSKVYLVRDNAKEFNINYDNYNIIDTPISPRAPNMNAIAERFVGSVRREALDNFIIFSRKQVYNILKEYVEYYNFNRPHQGINQDIPKGYVPQNVGRIKARPVHGGLFHHYYREAI